MWRRQSPPVGRLSRPDVGNPLRPSARTAQDAHNHPIAPIAATAKLPNSAFAAQWARLVPASEARGLEFDAIVVVGPEEIAAARPSGERDLYVALTRATKRLCTITVHPGAQRRSSPQVRG
ncbi:ATP-binding domain-containing protein [Streptomyces sp. NPDC096032]|uniref:ATP-binding domain-containing protein n=1 Tax=Streptomyces sp. NPDC096032 TaxID=3366070 RepID=UPI0037F6EEEB